MERNFEKYTRNIKLKSYDWLEFPYWTEAMAYNDPLHFVSWLNKKKPHLAAIVLIHYPEFKKRFAKLQQKVSDVRLEQELYNQKKEVLPLPPLQTPTRSSRRPHHHQPQESSRDWVRVQLSHEKYYWFNRVSGKSQWSCPFLYYS